MSFEDYSGHLVELRRALTIAEEDAARKNYPSSLQQLVIASEHLLQVTKSLRSLAANKAGQNGGAR